MDTKILWVLGEEDGKEENNKISKAMGDILELKQGSRHPLNTVRQVVSFWKGVGLCCALGQKHSCRKAVPNGLLP